MFFSQYNKALQVFLWVGIAVRACGHAGFRVVGFRLGSGMWMSEHIRQIMSIMFPMLRKPYTLL